MQITLQAITIKSLEQRLYEASKDGGSLVLSAQDVQQLVAQPWMDAMITDKAVTENGGTPAPLQVGLVVEGSSELETWNEFKRRVAGTPTHWRNYMQFRHVVASSDEVDATDRVITLSPSFSGLSIHMEGTGLCEMENGDPIFVEFWDERPRVLVWADINDPDCTVIELDRAMESNRRPDPPAAAVTE